MITVAFRFDCREWMGLAFAANMRDLFWQIDQHGDPYSVEIMRLKSGSVCIYQILNDDIEDGEPDAPEEVEWCDQISHGKWELPKWPDPVYPYKTLEEK